MSVFGRMVLANDVREHFRNCVDLAVEREQPEVYTLLLKSAEDMGLVEINEVDQDGIPVDIT